MIRMWNHFLIPKSTLLKGGHWYQFSHVFKTDVGELMDNGANKQRNTTLSDGDQYTTPGVYFVNLWGAWQNMPVSNCFGLFEVRNIGGNILQRLTTNESQIFFRIKQNNQPFNPWPTAAQ